MIVVGRHHPRAPRQRGESLSSGGQKVGVPLLLVSLTLSLSLSLLFFFFSLSQVHPSLYPIYTHFISVDLI